MRLAAKSVLWVAALALAAYLLNRTYGRYSAGELLSSLLSLPGSDLAFSLLFAALSYLCLTGFDTLALLYLGKRFPYPRIALASFTSLSIGHNLGFAGLSSGAIRYRFYSRWGVKPFEVAKLVLFCGVTVGLGLATLAGTTILASTSAIAPILHLTPFQARALAALMLVLPVAYVAAAALSFRPLSYRQWTLEFPSVRIAAAQVVLGSVNFLCVATCLHFALRSRTHAGFGEVVVAYVAANAATLLSHVPGGLGVIESVVTFLLPGEGVVGPLLAFRMIYFVLPLLLGGTLFLGFELRGAVASFSLSGRGRERETLPSQAEKP